MLSVRSFTFWPIVHRYLFTNIVMIKTKWITEKYRKLVWKKFHLHVYNSNMVIYSVYFQYIFFIQQIGGAHERISDIILDSHWYTYKCIGRFKSSLPTVCDYVAGGVSPGVVVWRFALRGGRHLGARDFAR